MTCFLGGIKVKKEYLIKEVIAYYISGYKEYKKVNMTDDFMRILKSIIIVVKKNIDIIEIMRKNTDLLSNIQFEWKLRRDDILAYATCIFYRLINKNIDITEEKIVKEMLREIYLYHPRETMRRANNILEELFEELE